MPTLSCEISQSLMNALRDAGADYRRAPRSHRHARARRPSGGSACHPVPGVYLGRVGQGHLSRCRYRRRAEAPWDLGLGTFADLDGEMVVVDGHFWRVPGAGAIREAADSDLAPFAVVTSFRPGRSLELASVVSIDNLLRQLDRLRTSDNLFFAVRIDGRFSRMHTRAVCKKAGVGLVDAAANQAEFEFHEIVGTILSVSGRPNTPGPSTSQAGICIF